MELATDIMAIIGWAMLGGSLAIARIGDDWSKIERLPLLSVISFGLIAASFVLG